VKKVSEKKLASGNIIGSATINSMIFGLLILLSGGIDLSPNEYITIVPILVVLSLTIISFLRFAWTGKQISKLEGLMLLGFYFSFLATESIIIMGLA